MWLKYAAAQGECLSGAGEPCAEDGDRHESVQHRWRFVAVGVGADHDGHDTGGIQDRGERDRRRADPECGVSDCDRGEETEAEEGDQRPGKAPCRDGSFPAGGGGEWRVGGGRVDPSVPLVRKRF